MTLKEILKSFFTAKAFWRFVWTTGQAFIAIIITFLIGLEVWWAVPLTAFLQWLSKEVASIIKQLKS